MRTLPISTNVAKSWPGLHNKGGILVGQVNIFHWRRKRGGGGGRQGGHVPPPLF